MQLNPDFIYADVVAELQRLLLVTEASPAGAVGNHSSPQMIETVSETLCGIPRVLNEAMRR